MRSGSSEKDSNVRPASGVRTMQTVGPSSTWTPLERASAARTSPSWRARPGFQVDPTAMPHGSDRERRPMRLSPRTPDGPSDTLSAGMPSRSTGGRYHRPAPAVSEAFSSSVIAPTSARSPRPSTSGRHPSPPARPTPSSPRVDEGAPAAPGPRHVPPPRARARRAASSAAGSITSSISKCSATCSALPCS